MIEDFIYEQSPNRQAILQHLHHLLAEELNLLPKIRYRVPFYYQNSWICYLNPVKGDAIELVFLRGQELSNSQGILDKKKRKQVSGITISDVESIPLEAIYEILQEALVLDETVPYSVKRK